MVRVGSVHPFPTESFVYGILSTFKSSLGFASDANKAATTLFHDVLGRKDSADATRNALGVLHRYKFLFNLPCSMDRNIKKGDFDLVITDYTRAKSLFGDTDVGVFKKGLLFVLFSVSI